MTTIAASLGTALENARLFDEVQKKNAEITESLERETASNDILQVIAESPTDIQPVFDVISRNAAQLSGSEDAIISLREGEILRVDAHYGDIPMIPIGEGIRFDRDSVAGRAILEGQPQQWIHNQPEVESEYPGGDEVAKKYGYRMTCAVPLMGEGKAIGCISIRRTRPELLTEKQIALIQSFANQAAIAVKNVRLFKAEQERVAELQIITSIQQGLAAELEFQAIVDLVGDKLRQVFNTPDLQITWYDNKTGLGHSLYACEHGERFHIPPTPFAQSGIRERLFKTRLPVIWGTLAEGDAISPVIPGTDASQSGIAVPIISADRVIGAVQLENYERDHAYGEGEARLLTTIAASLGAALENARLFDETQTYLKVNEQRNKELAILNSLSEAISKTLDVKSITHAVGDKMRERRQVRLSQPLRYVKLPLRRHLTDDLAHLVPSQRRLVL